MNTYVKTLIYIFKKLRKQRVFLENINRPMEAFTYSRFRFKECSALGRSITVTPDGSVAPCKSLVCADYFNDNLRDIQNLSGVESVRIWNKRSTLSLPTCKHCVAQGICGTGCSYDSFCLYKDISRVDPRACIFSKTMLEFMVWDIFDKFKPCKNDVFIPNVEQRKRIYENMPFGSKLAKSAGHEN
jgi:radical SAM protein with 4Fe4S-binding SPASM domain